MAYSSILNGPTLPFFSSPYSSPYLRHTLRISASVERGGISSTSSSLYEVLGIRTSATCQEIRSAYRKLARVLHPDVSVGGEDEFMRVHAAYVVLFDPDKRVVYDSSLALVGGGYSDVIGRRRRTWETDQCWWITSTDH